MKLSFVALVVLLSTVAGNQPSSTRRTSQGAQRSNVAKSTLGHSSGGTRVITRPNNHLTPAAKLLNSNRGNAEKTHRYQRTPAPNPKAPGIANSNRDEKTQQRQNAIQPTRSLKWKSENGKTQPQLKKGKDAQHTTTPKLKPSTGKLVTGKSGKVGLAHQNRSENTLKSNLYSPGRNLERPNRIGGGKSPQQRTSLPTRNSNPAAGKSGYANSVIVGKAQQQQTTTQKTSKLKPRKTEKSVNSNTDKGGKAQQERKTPTSTFKPPKTGMPGKPNIAKKGKTQHQQDENIPSMDTGKAEKSGYSNIGKDRQTNQQQNAATKTITSTFKPPTVEKSGNSSSTNVGQSQQKLNVSQHTSTLKPRSAEKSGNTSSVKDGEIPQQQNKFSSRTELHHHYRYSPPQQISYGSTFHPVYQGHPPIYVYEYRDSGSRFDNLLTGLALYNLGRNSYHHNSERQYSSTSGEICKLGISKRSGEYEGTRIDCNLMSSFIWEDTTSAAPKEQHAVKNTTKLTETVNGTENSTVTVTSTTVEDALKVKGPSIAVTPGMTCYMIRTFGGKTAMQKSVDCGLLQEYARSSLFRNNGQCYKPFMTTTFSFLVIFIGLGIC